MTEPQPNKAPSPPPLAPWQQQTIDQAAAAWHAGHLGHALLICGPEGLGQITVAKTLAHVLLSHESSRPTESVVRSPPIECHPDVHSVTLMPNATGDKLRSEIVIEQIRQLTAQLYLTTHTGKMRIALIYPAEAMNLAACNALLKTLEEPPANCYIWLICTHPSRLPATVRSRCQYLSIPLPSRSKSLQWLLSLGFGQDQAAAALSATSGHPMLALEWLSQGGMALQAEIANELALLAAGRVSALELAQRWTSDDQCASRLIHAAAQALQLAARHWQTPQFVKSLADWFFAANRARSQLTTPLRPDLAMTELLLAWQENCQVVPQGEEKSQ